MKFVILVSWNSDGFKGFYVCTKISDACLPSEGEWLRSCFSNELWERVFVSNRLCQKPIWIFSSWFTLFGSCFVFPKFPESINCIPANTPVPRIIRRTLCCFLVWTGNKVKSVPHTRWRITTRMRFCTFVCCSSRIVSILCRAFLSHLLSKANATHWTLRFLPTSLFFVWMNIQGQACFALAGTKVNWSLNHTWTFFSDAVGVGVGIRWVQFGWFCFLPRWFGRARGTSTAQLWRFVHNLLQWRSTHKPRKVFLDDEEYWNVQLLFSIGIWDSVLG